MSHWHWASFLHHVKAGLVETAVGETVGANREEARQHAQTLLDAMAASWRFVAPMAEKWRASPDDDLVSHHESTYAVFECHGPPCEASVKATAERVADALRQSGKEVTVAPIVPPRPT